MLVSNAMQLLHDLCASLLMFGSGAILVVSDLIEVGSVIIVPHCKWLEAITTKPIVLFVKNDMILFHLYYISSI